MKNPKILPIRAFYFLTVFLVLMSGCSKPSRERDDKKKEAEKQRLEVALTTYDRKVEEVGPTLRKAMITFLSGEVKRTEGGKWVSINIGDFVKQEDSISVGEDSYCEVQFGNKATIRMQANTTIIMEEQFFSTESSSVTSKMVSGTVLCKIKKLMGNESFNIATESATCGVRGTEFMVKLSRDEEMKVSVAEGKVAVRPVPVTIIRAKEKLKGKAPNLVEAIERIEQTEVVVESGMEVMIDKATAEENEKTLQPLERAIREILEVEKGGTVSQEKIEEFNKLVKEVNIALVTKMAAPETLSEKSTAEMEAINRMQNVEIAPEVIKELEKESEKPGVKKNFEQHKIYTVIVKANPNDAEIFLDGKLVGKGNFSGLYTQEVTLSFKVKKDGFITKTLTRTLSEATGKELLVELETKPEEKVLEKPEPRPEAKEKIIIRVTPFDAEIYLDGSRVARGMFSREFEVGESFSITAKKEGYWEESLLINVEKGSGRTYDFSLREKPKPQETIKVQVSPSDADIYLNGKLVGKGSYAGKFDFGEEIMVVAKKDGYKEESLRINVQENFDKSYSISLEAIYGRIMLQNKGQKGVYDVYLDGKNKGTNLTRLDNIPVGFHRVEIKQQRMLGLETIHSQGITISDERIIPIVFSIPDVMAHEQEKLQSIESFIRESFDKREERKKVEERLEEALELLEETEYSETLKGEKEKFKELQEEYRKKWIFW